MKPAAPPPGAPGPGGRRSPGSRLPEAVTEFARSPVSLVGALLLGLLLLVALLGAWLAPQNPYDIKTLDIMDAQQPPGSRSMAGGVTFLLGTDSLGRDLFSAILYGLQTSFVVGGGATLIAACLGTSLGLLAGWRRGWVDTVVMRLADLQLALPAILVALVLISILGPGRGNVVIALVLVQWAVYARTVRSLVLNETGRDYVLAARGLALDPSWVALRHVLPNCLSPVLVVATVAVGGAIMLEATLSFLGIGLPVSEPSLGLLIANGFAYLMSGAYWISVFPGVTLMLTILSINLVGDRLREVLNPNRAS